MQFILIFSAHKINKNKRRIWKTELKMFKIILETWPEMRVHLMINSSNCKHTSFSFFFGLSVTANDCHFIFITLCKIANYQIIHHKREKNPLTLVFFYTFEGRPTNFLPFFYFVANNLSFLLIIIHFINI